MDNKYFSVEEMNNFIENLELAFTDYGDKADTFISKCKEFQNDDSFTGERATVVKDLVGDNEVSLVNAQKDMQAKLLSMYKHAVDSFAEKVDSAPNARLDLETLDMVESDLKAIYRDVDTTCAEIENIAKEMNAKYGHFGHITVPNADPLRESLENLCGGYNPEAGFYHDLKQKFINWDEEECAYIESQLLSDEIEKANSSAIQANTILDDILNSSAGTDDSLLDKKIHSLKNQPKMLFGDGIKDTTSDKNLNNNVKKSNNSIISIILSRILISKIKQCIKKYPHIITCINDINLFSKIQNTYDLTSDELNKLIKLKDKYSEELISLSLTIDFNSSEADKLIEQLLEVSNYGGIDYLLDAYYLVEQYDLTSEQKTKVYRLEKLIGHTKDDVYYSVNRVAGMEVVAAALYARGNTDEFIACVLGNCCSEGLIGHIEGKNNKDYYLRAEDYFSSKNTNLGSDYGDKCIYELDDNGEFLNVLEDYITEKEPTRILGVGTCQWTYCDRLPNLIKKYKYEIGLDEDDEFDRYLNFKEAANAEANFIVDELEGTGIPYSSADENFYKKAEEVDFSIIDDNEDFIRKETVEFANNYEKGTIDSNGKRASSAWNVYKIIKGRVI